MEPRTRQEYIESFHPRPVPALVKIRGFHLSMVMADWMHLACLGIAQVVIGSAVLEMASEGFFGCTSVRRKDVRIALQLRNAFHKFVLWARQRHLGHSQPMFTKGRFSQADKKAHLRYSKGRRRIPR
eukprot:1677985-Alexandrium_andersonii.AAC.1